MSLSLEQLKIKRRTAKATLTRYKNKIGATTQNVENLGIFQTILEKINDIWSEYQNVQNQIELIELAIPEKHEENLLKSGEERDEFEMSFFDTVSRIKRSIAKIREESNEPIIINNTGVRVVGDSSSQTSVKLPESKLPQFKGDFADWIHFRDCFDATIIKNKNIANIQKFQYLQSALQGKALDIIKTLPVSGDNFNEAWEAVCKRYDNKKALVFNCYKAMHEIPIIRKGTSSALCQIHDAFVGSIRTLKSLGRETENLDDPLSYLILNKLDPESLQAWNEKVDNKEPPKVKELLEFIENRAYSLENREYQKTNISIPNSKPTKNNEQRVTSHFSASEISCVKCKAKHALDECPGFKKKSPHQRFKIVKNSRICLNCLRSSSHSAKSCTHSTCQVCKQSHHTLLHFPNDKSGSKNEETLGSSNDAKNENQELSTNSLSYHSYNSSNSLLSTAIIHVFDVKGNPIRCRALLDTGSQSSFITLALASKLGLKRTPFKVSVIMMEGAKIPSTESMQVSLKSRVNDFGSKINCIIVDRISNKIPCMTIPKSDIVIPQGIELADPDFNKSSDVDMIIGSELVWDLILSERIRLNKNAPIFRKTELGWIVAGKTDNWVRRRQIDSSENVTCCNFVRTEDLNKSVDRFWEVENKFESKVKDLSMDFCEQHFEENTVRDSEGKFIVTLPEKPEILSKLVNNLDIAIKRFLSLEKRLERIPDVKLEYVRFMCEYLELGHMHEVDLTETYMNVLQYYLPHHCIIRELRETTKLRVVFDGSCKTRSGVSLNDALHSGPVIQEELFIILIRFREFQIALTADITKMYRMVKVNPSQTQLQRIVWREKPTDKIRIFELDTLTYGTSPAAFLAIRVMRKIAELYESQFPIEAMVIKDNFYVDDMLAGEDTVEEVANLKEETTSILSKGGYELRKFSSNLPEFCDKKIPSNNVKIELPRLSESRVLGMFWDREQDNFTFQNPIQIGLRENITKREMLSKIATLFDPLGLLGPIIMVGKLIMQELWRLKIDWDQEVPEGEVRDRWTRLLTELPEINKINVPRKIYSSANLVSRELHGFCDASEVGYGACIYLVSVEQDGSRHSSLICSKSKVAPLKNISIPRLELCGAVLLAQLMDKIKLTLKYEIHEIKYWTDSSIVLSWLQNCSREFVTFVANRIGEIQQLTQVYDWNHVRTADNPADILSRGIMPSLIIKCSHWWHGPDWIVLDKEHWPKSNFAVKYDETLERKKTIVSLSVVTHESEFEVLDDCSSFLKLLRIIAHCFRFLNKLRKRANVQVGPIRCNEYKVAENGIVKFIQNEHFKREFKALKNGENLPNNSPLKFLNPFIDEQGIIRVGGRLRNASISFDAKHPIVIPNKHKFTELLICHKHKEALHSGAQTTLSIIRQKYWIVKGRNYVRKIIIKCVICFRASPKNNPPLMGNFPQNRITRPKKPFENVGIDFCGPFLLKEGSRRNSPISKVYVAVYICFATKAIHLEIVADLTCQGFLNSFKRFIARRGYPSNVYTDNGTNFVAANRELKELQGIFEKEETKNSLISNFASKQIEWHFSPARAPHFGGLWEAAVRSFKTLLNKIATTNHYRYDEFATLLAGIEAILNSRPILPIFHDPNDLSYLSPGHFLIGDALTSYPEPSLEFVPVNRLSHWQHIEQMRQTFWKKWTRDYLNQQQQRHKWHKKSKNLEPGQLVVVSEENLPPLKWSMARVIDVHPGEDKIVRAATIKTSKGHFKRPVNKLFPLPVD